MHRVEPALSATFRALLNAALDRDADATRSAMLRIGYFGPATARAAFLVAPDGFRLAEQSARDNAYMADAAAFEAFAHIHGQFCRVAVSRTLMTSVARSVPSLPASVWLSSLRTRMTM